MDWTAQRHRGEVRSVETAVALEGLGLEGDHRSTKTPGSGRQVTLISVEFIDMICRHSGRDHIPPASLRRNLLISGINLNLLRHQRVRIGEVILEPAALCHPCSRMNEVLGPGGAAAMYGYGGLCARIIKGGTLRCGDRVVRLPPGAD